MSLNNYQLLQKESLNQSVLLGCQLPELKKGTLQMDSHTLSSADLAGEVIKFQPESGWIMTRSETRVLDAMSAVPDFTDVIEAEFESGEQSLKIRLVHGDDYLITSFNVSAAEAPHQCYKTQNMVLNTNQHGRVNCVRYRLWWQQQTAGVNRGRWEPLAQQFMGFAAKENA